jgi:hypothetical protein
LNILPNETNRGRHDDQARAKRRRPDPSSQKRLVPASVSADLQSALGEKEPERRFAVKRERWRMLNDNQPNRDKAFVFRSLNNLNGQE